MSIFQHQGGPSNLIAKKITANTVTVVVDTTGAQTGGNTYIDRFEVNENAGSTPNLTVELYDTGNTTSYYLGDSIGHAVWKAKAVTAGQSVHFNEGYVLPNTWQIRITSSDAAGKFDFIGSKVGRSPGDRQ